jgi:hypothetical protein
MTKIRLAGTAVTDAEAVFYDAVAAAEMTRQVARKAAGTPAATKAADVKYCKTVAAAAAVAGQSGPAGHLATSARAQLRELTGGVDLSVDAKSFAGISATTASFVLHEGSYTVAVSATFGGGSVKLQQSTDGGATFTSVGASTDFTANGSVTVDLTLGIYRFTIATATAVTCSVIGVPY